MSGTPLGFDMTSLLALAEASGYDARAVAALLPPLEAGAVRGILKKIEENE
jgi:hypothetical protein